MTPKRILVPTDFSDTAQRAIDAAVDEALRSDASIELVHVYQPPTYWGAETLVLPETEDAMRRHIEESLAAVARDVRARGVPCTTTWFVGAPWIEVARHAREGGFDLVVMGTHGRTGMSHVLLGSVAERVIQRARRPVLVVPPPEQHAGG
jgi:nucleotide-binding universal stress UspA family protein